MEYNYASPFSKWWRSLYQKVGAYSANRYVLSGEQVSHPVHSCQLLGIQIWNIWPHPRFGHVYCFHLSLFLNKNVFCTGFEPMTLYFICMHKNSLAVRNILFFLLSYYFLQIWSNLSIIFSICLKNRIKLWQNWPTPPKFRHHTEPKFRLSQAVLPEFRLKSNTPPKFRQLHWYFRQHHLNLGGLV